ncbi:hypothetical protein ACLE20_00525 [Rhizobium sp. YIM 134829]|uniref:hypothetical protein n=1 Tax=Rhizobium sp. YIM 134829 TaxID=3390453 RepID=UPI00397A9E69
MATVYTAKLRPKTVQKAKHLAPSGPVTDGDDYGGIGAEDFERQMEADNRQRHQAVIDQSTWSPAGKAGW